MGSSEKDFFARIDALFQDAVDRDPEERDAFLELQAAEPRLLAEVRALLDEDEAGGELEEIVDSSWREAASAPTEAAKTRTLGAESEVPGEAVPASIGPYRVLGSLGRGGLATVYLAERTSEFSMPVALKRIRRGMDTDDIVERLRLERQILARLVHPNIARIHDGGSDEDGQPYLVMEVIEGVRIDQWCAARKLSVRGRLELFRQACEAVEFAHQNLILHRDIKPSNILVTEDGTLKLLDFGIAKVLAGAGGEEESSQQTATGNRLLTPDYASPEQLAGEPLTTASDIYSLGVMLFQLITGRLPHGLTPAEIWGGQRKDAPLASRSAAKERETENPQTPPADRWSQSVAVEIDAILAKALELEPARRYGTVRELDDDLARLLEDRPVLARRPTLRYRLGKMARRHRALVALGTLALLSLLIGIIGTSWQARVADRERLRAEQEKAQAEAVADFLVEIFEVSDPYGESRLIDQALELAKPRGQTITARELLDAAALRTAASFGDEGYRQSRLRRVIARAYRNLSLYDESRALLEQADAMLEPLQGGSRELDIERALVQADLGWLDGRQGRFDSASRRLQASEAALLGLGAESELAQVLELFGELEYWREDMAAAEARYDAARELYRGIDGERSLSYARAQAGLAKVLNRELRYEEMEALVRENLEVRRERLGEDHPLVLETLNDLAVAVQDQEAAAAVFADLIERQRQVLGPNHADLMNTLFNHASMLRKLDRFEEAEVSINEAWRIAEAASATVTPLAADVLLLKGLLREVAGDPKDAVEIYGQVLELNRRLFGDEHLETVIALIRLGRAWAVLGDSQAEEVLREALAISQRESIGQAPFAYLGLAELRIAQGEFAAAEEEIRFGLETLEGQGGGTIGDWRAAILKLRRAQALAGAVIPGDEGTREQAIAAALAAKEWIEASVKPGHRWIEEANGLIEGLRGS